MWSMWKLKLVNWLLGYNLQNRNRAKIEFERELLRCHTADRNNFLSKISILKDENKTQIAINEQLVNAVKKLEQGKELLSTTLDNYKLEKIELLSKMAFSEAVVIGQQNEIVRLRDKMSNHGLEAQENLVADYELRLDLALTGLAAKGAEVILIKQINCDLKAENEKLKKIIQEMSARKLGGKKCG